MLHQPAAERKRKGSFNPKPDPGNAGGGICYEDYFLPFRLLGAAFLFKKGVSVMNQSFRTKRLVESALMIALSTILSFIVLFRLPFGGSLTPCCMLPVILISYRYGCKWGFATSFAFSLIQGIQGIAEGTFSAAALGVENGVFNGGFFSGSPLFAAFGIFLLDYIIAFTALGIGGIFRDKIKNKPLSLVCGILVAGLLRYAAHVISGAIFFGIWGEWFFTQEGFFAWGQTLVDMFPGKSLYVLYSLIYNLFFLLPETGLTAAAGYLISKAMPKLLVKQEPQAK